MKIILVPINNRSECAVALKQAFELGKKLRASIKGCHIRAHDDSVVEFSGAGSKNKKNYHGAKNNQNAKDFFVYLAEKNDYRVIKKQKSKVRAFWVEEKGCPEKLFSILGPVSDLIIVSRPTKKGKSLARQFMLSAILKSARPVIILPQNEVSKIGRRICIAWNQSTQAAQAVAAAIPLLKLANKVSIITCNEETKAGPKAKRLISYLRSWKIDAKRTVCSGKNDSDALMNGFHKTRSDLMVMGGYSNSKFKQFLFGGVTDYMLNEANVPVLMLHSPR